MLPATNVLCYLNWVGHESFLSNIVAFMPCSFAPSQSSDIVKLSVIALVVAILALPDSHLIQKQAKSWNKDF